MDRKYLANIEVIYRELKKNYSLGNLSKEQYLQEIKQLAFKDPGGNRWRYNGEWYTYKDDGWVRSNPYEIEWPSSPADEKEPSPPVKPPPKARKINLDQFRKNRVATAKNLVISLVSIAILVFLVVMLVRSSGSGKKDSPGQTTPDRQVQKPARDNSEKKPDEGFQFSAHQLVGEAAYPPNDSPPHTPARIRALLDALLRRVRVMHGIRTEQKDKRMVQECAGDFLGFSLSQTVEQDPDQGITERMRLVTPGKKRITLSDEQPSPADDDTLTQLLTELKGQGLAVRFEDQPEQNRIQARLQIEKEPLFDLDPHYLIKNRGVGRISLNTPIEDIEKRLPDGFFVIERKIQNRYEGYKTYFFHKVYSAEKKPMFIINSNEKIVLKIQIEDPAYRTSRGIRLGDTLGKLRAFYPDLRISVVENQIPYASFRDSSIRFYLQLNKINLPDRIFPMDTKIVSIWIETGE